MIETFFSNPYSVIGTVLLVCLGAYLNWRVGHKARLAAAAANFRITFDHAMFSGIHGHQLHGALIREVPKHRAAATEFRRFLGPLDNLRFNRAWKDYHGGNDEYPDFVPYYIRDNGCQLLIKRLENLRNVADQT